MTFKDFIPAGEDTGAIGDGGFRDYVPEPKPIKHEDIQEPVEEKKPIKTVISKKKT